MRLGACAVLVGGVVITGLPARLCAQDTTIVVQDSTAIDTTASSDSSAATAALDTLARRPPLKPMAALWRSLLVPGWGQAKLDRKLTAGIFVTWEGITLAMSFKVDQELRYLRRTNSGRGDAKKGELQDWMVLVAFNHLFSGLEAYVSAHLWDFPPDLRVEALPGVGGTGFGGRVVIPVRIR